MEPPSHGRNTRPLETPTEQPTTRAAWIERINTRKSLALIFSLSLLFLTLATVGGWYFLIFKPIKTDGLQPDLSLTPPVSLAELSTQYPELASILEDADLDSAYKEFLLAYQQGGTEAALALARQRGLVNDKDELRITLELDTADHTTLVAQLEAQGIQVTAASGHLIDLAVPLQLIEQLAQSGELHEFFAGISELEHVKRIRLPRSSIQEHDNLKSLTTNKQALFQSATHFLKDGQYRKRFPFLNTIINFPSTTYQSREVVIESLDKLNIPAWHAAGYTGKGIKIGILDMGFNTYRSFLGNELPENVEARSFIAGLEIDNTETEHGTACAEIIHDIAPEAELFFTAYETDVEQFQAIDWLVSQGVNIISHSAGSILGPMDGTGLLALKVDSLVARNILWVNSSGNMAQAHYRAKFQDKDGDGFHEFKPGDELLGFVPIERVAIALNWDAWDTGIEDYDLYIMNSEQEIVASSKNVQDGPGDETAEFISYFFSDPGPYFLAFHGRRYTRPAIFDLYIYNAYKMEYTTAEYSITTPADSHNAITVGATHWSDDALEDYSSQGPSHDGRVKPDLTAPAGVSSAVYGEEFSGTSASAPHVAGAAALIWQANQDFSVQQVSQYLKEHAKDLGSPGVDSQFGYGRLHLGEIATSSVPLPPTKELPKTEEPAVEVPTVESPPDTQPPPEETETTEPEFDLVISKQDLLKVTLGLIGCVALPGMIGIGGIVLVLVVWPRSRTHRQPRQPVQPAKQAPPAIASFGPPPQQYPPIQQGQPPQPPPPPRKGDFLPTVVAGEPGPPAAVKQARCSRCGSVIRSGARFCNVCGNLLTTPEAAAAPSIYCTQCGNALRPTSKFCPRCGKSR